jgi:hypothetical protein
MAWTSSQAISGAVHAFSRFPFSRPRPGDLLPPGAQPSGLPTPGTRPEVITPPGRAAQHRASGSRRVREQARPGAGASGSRRLREQAPPGAGRRREQGGAGHEDREPRPRDASRRGRIFSGECAAREAGGAQSGAGAPPPGRPRWQHQFLMGYGSPSRAVRRFRGRYGDFEARLLQRGPPSTSAPAPAARHRPPHPPPGIGLRTHGLASASAPAPAASSVTGPSAYPAAGHDINVGVDVAIATLTLHRRR